MTDENGSAAAGNPEGQTAPSGETPQSAADALTTQTAQPAFGQLDENYQQLVDKKGWKQPADAIKSYAELEKFVGQDRLAPPPEGEELANWAGWEKLGVPQDANGYELQRPELPEGIPYDEGLESTAKDAAAYLKLAPWQLQGVLDTYARHQVSQIAEAQQQAQAQWQQTQSELKTNWGNDYDKNMRSAQRFARFLAPDLPQEKVGQLIDTLSATVGEAALFQRFAALGTEVSEDNLVTGNAPEGFAMTPEKAKAELEQINSNPENVKIMQDKRHPGYKALMDKRRALYDTAYPGTVGQ